MNLRLEKIKGSIFGLAIGDAFGAPFEGGIFERALWSLIGNSSDIVKWTDDTQMSINVMQNLIEYGQISQDDLAHKFAASFEWSRGYGAGAAKLLKRIRSGQSWQQANKAIFLNGSFGNGGAMRAPLVGVFYAEQSEQNQIKAIRDSAEITHAHMLGIEGAIIVGLATACFYHGIDSQEIVKRLIKAVKQQTFIDKLTQVESWLKIKTYQTKENIVKELGNGVAATESCVTAIYLAIVFRNQQFDELLEFAIKLGGDVDTIAAMAGAMWGAENGYSQLPQEKIKRLEQSELIHQLSHQFDQKLK